MQTISVFCIPTHSPSDTKGLQDLLQAGHLLAEDIIAILGKTEGNGCVNDFTREYATSALVSLLASLLNLSFEKIHQRIAFIMSGGTEGVLSPHIIVFSRRISKASPLPDKRLAVGIAFTREFSPEELGRSAQVNETALAVRKAMEDAGIVNECDVHFVQIKCPLLTSERIEEARQRGYTAVTDNTYASMAYSRAASALGVAVALQEIKSTISDQDILNDLNLYSSVASASAGIELNRSIVIVMGNSFTADSEYTIGHSVMQDAIDLGAVLDAFATVGLDTAFRNKSDTSARLVTVLVKAEASPDGKIRGFRHTMLDDSDINSTRHARALVGGLVAGVAGHGMIYVSGGAEHQGPPGGGPVAVIAKLTSKLDSKMNTYLAEKM